jgi:hypothetical protein
VAGHQSGRDFERIVTDGLKEIDDDLSGVELVLRCTLGLSK